MAEPPEGEDDRFADLGSPPRRLSAAERFEEEDRLRPEPDDPSNRPPQPPRRGNKYAWAGVFVMLMGIGVLAITTTLPNQGAGLEGPRKGRSIPAFAAPLATGNVSCEDDEPCAANVCQRASECNESAGSRPACKVRGDSVVNVCELRRKPLVLTFLATEGTDCEPQVDRIERMRDEFPGVRFAAVMGGEDKDEVAQIVRRRGWKLPVAVDRDGAVLNLYGVGVCPTTVFSAPGGKVEATRLGNLTEAQLRAEVRRLLRSG